ncbi:hypothetical protein Tco_1502774 [Tanacetum coccineum]
MSNRHQELSSPEQTATGKDFSNPLIVDSLLKTIWLSMHLVFYKEALASPSNRSAEASTDDNGEVKINATIDGHSLSITEGSLRRHLKLADQDGITSIPTTEIFEQLALMGYHTDSDKLTFQKGAFSPQWSMKVFSNMKRSTKGFSGQEVALFPNMLDVTEPSTSPSRITSSPSPTPSPSPEPTPAHTPSPTQPSPIQPSPTQPSPTQPSPTQPSPTQPGTEHHLPTPHDSPLHVVHSHGSDEGSLKLQELMNLVKVKKLESQIKIGKARRQALGLSLQMMKRLKMILLTGEEVIDDGEKASDEVSTAGAKKSTASEEVPIVSTAEVHLSTAGECYLFMTLGRDRQERLSYAEAIRLEEQMNEEQRAQVARDEEIARQWDAEERQRAMDEAKSAKKIDWNDPSVIRYHTQKMKPKTVAQARRNMIKYLKNQGNYKISDFKGMSYNDIRPIFEKVWDFNQNIEPMDAEHGSEKQKSPAKEKSPEKVMEEEKSIPRKSTRKRQKLVGDAAVEELKGLLDIIPREEVPIEVESISTKFPIVDWKTYVLTETFMYYQIFRGYGSSKNYKILSEMLEDFDRQDVEELYRLVKERYSTSRPEGFDLMLWGDLHTLFEPDEDDEIWKDQHEYNLLSWRLCDFCGIHILLLENRLAIHMLTEKKYPLSQEMLTKMLSRKLEVDHESSQAFELLRFIRSQVQK